MRNLNPKNTESKNMKVNKSKAKVIIAEDEPTTALDPQLPEETAALPEASIIDDTVTPDSVLPRVEGNMRITMLESIRSPRVGFHDIRRLLKIDEMKAQATYTVPAQVAHFLVDAKKAVILSLN